MTAPRQHAIARLGPAWVPASASLGQPGAAWAWISTSFSEGSCHLVERLLLLWHGRNEPEFAHAVVMGQGLRSTRAWWGKLAGLWGKALPTEAHRAGCEQD